MRDLFPLPPGPPWPDLPTRITSEAISQFLDAYRNLSKALGPEHARRMALSLVHPPSYMEYIAPKKRKRGPTDAAYNAELRLACELAATPEEEDSALRRVMRKYKRNPEQRKSAKTQLGRLQKQRLTVQEFHAAPKDVLHAAIIKHLSELGVYEQELGDK